MCSIRKHCQIFIEFEIPREIFEKSSNIKSHENPSSGGRFVPCGRTDGQTNRHTWQSWKSLFTTLRHTSKNHTYVPVCPQVLPRFFTISLHRLFANSPTLATLISCIFKHVCSQHVRTAPPQSSQNIHDFFFQGVLPTVEWGGWHVEETRTEIKMFLEGPQAKRLFERPRSKWNHNITMMIFFVRPSISYTRLVRQKFYNCSRDCTITCKSITEPVSEVRDNQTNILGFSWFWNSLRI